MKEDITRSTPLELFSLGKTVRWSVEPTTTLFAGPMRASNRTSSQLSWRPEANTSCGDHERSVDTVTKMASIFSGMLMMWCSQVDVTTPLPPVLRSAYHLAMLQANHHERTIYSVNVRKTWKTKYADARHSRKRNAEDNFSGTCLESVTRSVRQNRTQRPIEIVWMLSMTHCTFDTLEQRDDVWHCCFWGNHISCSFWGACVFRSWRALKNG